MTTTGVRDFLVRIEDSFRLKKRKDYRATWFFSGVSVVLENRRILRISYRANGKAYYRHDEVHLG